MHVFDSTCTHIQHTRLGGGEGEEGRGGERRGEGLKGREGGGEGTEAEGRGGKGARKGNKWRSEYGAPTLLQLECLLLPW